jgi:hypothetical protein
VPPISASPGGPNTNDIPGLGNIPAVTRVRIVIHIATNNGMPKSFLKNGIATKKMERGIAKYWMPPHEAFAKPSRKPAASALRIINLTCRPFIAETNRYVAIIPRNNPRGSDLNHPRFPR